MIQPLLNYVCNAHSNIQNQRLFRLLNLQLVKLPRPSKICMETEKSEWNEQSHFSALKKYKNEFDIDSIYISAGEIDHFI